MDNKARYKDLLITNGDLTLDLVEEPEITSDAWSVGQDIKHAIIESGLATDLIAERSPTLRIDILTQIELIAEQDTRIIPGTVKITEETKERIYLCASAYSYEELIKIGIITDDEQQPN